MATLVTVPSVCQLVSVAKTESMFSRFYLILAELTSPSAAAASTGDDVLRAEFREVLLAGTSCHRTPADLLEHEM